MALNSNWKKILSFAAHWLWFSTPKYHSVRWWELFSKWKKCCIRQESEVLFEMGISWSLRWPHTHLHGQDWLCTPDSPASVLWVMGLHITLHLAYEFLMYMFAKNRHRYPTNSWERGGQFCVFYFSLSLSNTGHWTQALKLVRQAVYHWLEPQPFSIYSRDKDQRKKPKASSYFL